MELHLNKITGAAIFIGISYGSHNPGVNWNIGWNGIF